MRIEEIIWLRDVVDKLAIKHHVETDEVEQVMEHRPKIRLVEKGQRRGEDVYMALGETDTGRYLAVLFIYKRLTKQALVLSARDMARKERKRYGKK